MSRLIVYLFFNLIFSNLVFAEDKSLNYACRWDNKNKIPCIEIISLTPNSSNFFQIWNKQNHNYKKTN